METIFLTAFFRFHDKGPEYGFKRLELQHIWKTEEDARSHLSFCDEAGWYTGALLEERSFGWRGDYRKMKRIWLIQQEDGTMKEIEEPKGYKNCINLIG
jgi:hypothetical protein